MSDPAAPHLRPSRAPRDELDAISRERDTTALTRPQPGDPEQPEAQWLRDDSNEGWSYPLIRIPIPELPGALSVGPIPGRFRDGLAAVHLDLIARAGVQRLLCLTSTPSYEEAARVRFADHFHLMAILDYEVPSDDTAFEAEIAWVLVALRAGKRVLVHCAAGCGRTGLFVSCLLVALGWDAMDAVRHFRRHRGCGPETGDQVAWVLRFASRSLGSAASEV